MQKPTQVVGRRVAAFVIDLVLWVVIIMATWYALTTSVPGGCLDGGVEIGGKCRGFAQTSDRTFWLVFVAIAFIGIFVVIQGLRGKTPGKAILGIKVVKRGGDVPGIWRTSVRELFWVVDIFLIGWATAMLSPWNQRPGDMVAGTYVVNRDFSAATGAQPEPQAAQPEQQAAQPEQQGGQPDQQGGQPPNWYPDPHGQARLRYWDGERWTEHTSA